MLILGIDTSISETSVAITGAEGKILHQVRKPVDPSHSSSLLTLIEEALSVIDAAVTSLDALAVTEGPGSFTGLRIGLMTAAGLADATSVPLCGVPTLDAIMAAHEPSGAWPYLCPVINARRDEVYAALFRQQGGGYQRIDEDGAFGPADLATGLPGPTFFIGDGFAPYKKTIEERASFPVDYAYRPTHPVALGAALVAARQLAHTEGPPLRPAPRYVRPPQAVINWEKLHSQPAQEN